MNDDNRWLHWTLCGLFLCASAMLVLSLLDVRDATRACKARGGAYDADFDRCITRVH